MASAPTKGRVDDAIVCRVLTLAFEPATALVQDLFAECERDSFFNACHEVRRRGVNQAD